MPEDIKTPTPEVVDDKTPPVDDKPPVEDKKDTTTPDEKDNKSEEQKEPTKEDEKKEPEKPEDKKPEEKPEDKKDDDVVAGLQEQISKLQQELEQTKANNDSKVALDQANTLLNVQKNLVTEYEGILTGIIDAKLEGIPDNLKELVPANLSLSEKLDWITKAEKSGVFKAKDTDVEIGKPLNPNNVKQTTDTSKLSASSLMAMAYGNSQKGKGKK